jgi:hypothetical protein
MYGVPFKVPAYTSVDYIFSQTTTRSDKALIITEYRL